MASKNTTTTQSTTQNFLEIFDVTNNLVIMKGGMVSVVLTVSAINFGLLAEEEQDAVMYAYAGLLNSLNYPIQIVINSQTKDVTKYLSLLKDQEESATSAIIRRRIGQYREFVANLIQERNVLDKKFYVVIPATGLELGFATAKGLLPGQGEINISTYERSVIIEKAKNVLEPRRDHLIAQFARIGLYARELETQEIIQLFYTRYNPEAIEGQQIEESSSYTAPLVSAQVRESMFEKMMATPVPAPAAPATSPVSGYAGGEGGYAGGGYPNAVSSTESVLAPAQPVLDAGQPAVEPAQPALETNQSLVGLTQPELALTQPILQPTQPALALTQPMLQLAQTPVEPALPLWESTQSTQPTQSILQSTQPILESAQPMVVSTQPTSESTQPTSESTQPALESTQPMTTTIEPTLDPELPTTAAQPTLPPAESVLPPTQTTLISTQPTPVLSGLMAGPAQTTFDQPLPPPAQL